MDSQEKSPISNSLFGRALDGVEIGICFTSMLLMTVVIFVHVIFRYIFKSPLTWSEEVAKMCLVWVAFGGSAYAFKVGAHVGVTFFIDRLPEKARFIVQLLIDFINILFFAFICYFSIKICMGQIGKFSRAANIPLVIPWLSLPVGSLLVILRLIYTDIKLLNSRKGSETK